MYENTMPIDVDRLKTEISRRYSIKAMGAWTQIMNGDECLVWHVEDESMPLVVRVSPCWRTIAEIQWVHELMIHCGQSIPEVVMPTVADDGTTVFLFASYPVTVFPFIEGNPLNRRDARLRDNAAGLLARIHRAAFAWSPIRSRPPSKITKPQSLPQARYPDVLRDAAFDAWVDTLSEYGLVIAPIHGDFYARNLLTVDAWIPGVIDWDEAAVTYLMAEAGWSAWEFCKNEAGDDLHLDNARAFLNAYFDENPPCPPSEMEQAINFIRLRLRNEVVANLARKERREDWDKAYTEAEIRAFVTLCDVRL